MHCPLLLNMRLDLLTRLLSMLSAFFSPLMLVSNNFVF